MLGSARAIKPVALTIFRGDFAMRTGAPLEVVENLQQLEDEGDAFETIEDIWPDYPSKEDFFFNEDEY